MKKLMTAIGLSAALLACAGSAQAADLSAKQAGIVAIAAQTAVGDLQKLRTELIKGLEAGLTVNEIKEVLVQLYAYTGFPRSLNGINTFMKVIDERTKAGIKDPVGKEASALPANLDKDAYGARMRADLGGRKEIPPAAGYQLFAPAIDTFLKEHLFCDIFIRDNLDHQSRELATIGALAAMTGTQGQLVFHMNAAMNTGTDENQMKQFVEVIGQQINQAQKDSAQSVLDRVLKQRTSKK
ncbi:MAG: carboxymuconolactone decarboxylase family protein [Sutterellaceae bacterium]|nr:carboxymuconolactone decarboxylase family protein [Sutterellaceae bacterium]